MTLETASHASGGPGLFFEVCGRPGCLDPAPRGRKYCSALCAQRDLADQRLRGERPPCRVSPVGWTPAMDDELRRDYLRRPTRALAKRFSCKVHQVRGRAARLGLTRRKSPPWTQEQEAQLRDRWGVETVQALAKRTGRTTKAVTEKAKALGLHVGDCRETLSATRAAALIGVDRTKLARLCADGTIKAKQVPGQGRCNGEGGKRWDIKPADLRKFVLDYPGEVNLRCVAGHTVEFINLVAGRW